MGYELRRLLREALGPEVTGLQRAVALEIADDASDETRESYATLEDLARWTAAKDANVVRNALKRLAAAKWEFRVPIGKGRDGRLLYAIPGLRMTFKVPPFEEVALATPSGEKEEPGLSLGGATATPRTPKGGAGAPTEGAGAPSQGAGATPFSSYPSTPHRDKTLPRVGGAIATPTPPVSDDDLRAFGAFWTVYPKKKSREEALQAWISAIGRGANPQHMVDAATRYARERADEDARYTKHPATWLNKGCYDDEPDTNAGRPPLRAVAGGYQPYQQPPEATYQNQQGF